ncbi:MAG: hypothetical protein ACRDAX_01415 [Propionibacteriaceae bacterium]
MLPKILDRRHRSNAKVRVLADNTVIVRGQGTQVYRSQVIL